jgi:rhodanese-related sulfurtransferase
MQVDPVWVAGGAAIFAWIAMSRLGKISGEKARALVGGGALLIDVRSEAEFGAGHIAGAMNIPVDRIAARAGELAKRERPIVVYCASGMRSAGAKRALVAAGIRDVHDLGAMSRW